MKAKLLVLLGVAALLAVACRGGGDRGHQAGAAPGVPMFRGDAARTGLNPGPGVRDSPKVLWQVETASPVASSPVVYNGTVYAGGFLGQVYALDAATGQERWRFDAHGDINSSLAAVDGVVYVNSGTGEFGDEEDTGRVDALDAATGEELWHFETEKAVYSSPAVVDGSVYVSCLDGYVYALKAGSGKVRWRFQTDSPSYSSPAVANGVVYALGRGYLYALDASSGEKRWSKGVDAIYGSPAAAGSRVYVLSRDQQVIALKADTGEYAWWTKLDDDNLSSPAVAEATMYVVGYALHAIDRGTGEIQWARAPFRWQEGTPHDPTLVNDILYVGAGDPGRPGRVHAFDAATGSDLWYLDMDYGVTGGPVVANGALYVAGADDMKGYISAIGGGPLEEVPSATPTASPSLLPSPFADAR